MCGRTEHIKGTYCGKNNRRALGKSCRKELTNPRLSGGILPIRFK